MAAVRRTDSMLGGRRLKSPAAGQRSTRLTKQSSRRQGHRLLLMSEKPESAAQGVACPVCGKVLLSKLALMGHSKTHAAAAAADSGAGDGDTSDDKG